MQYRGSLGSYVQSNWLLVSVSVTVVCTSSWARAEDDEQDDREEEEDDEEDWWLEDLVLPLRK